MVKKLILFSLQLICLQGNLSAEVIIEDKALIAATNWYRHYAPENKKSATVADSLSTITTNAWLFISKTLIRGALCWCRPMIQYYDFIQKSINMLEYNILWSQISITKVFLKYPR